MIKSGLLYKFNYFLFEPLKKSDFVLFRFRFSQFMHIKTNGLYSYSIYQLFKVLYPKKKMPLSALMDESQIKSTVIQLKQKGWKILDYTLSQEDIDSILAFATTHPIIGRKSRVEEYFDLDYPPTRDARYLWKVSDLLNHRVIHKLVSDGFMHKIAQEYLGSEPVLTHITFWLDPVAQKDEAHEYKYDGPHSYHQDNDGPKYLKFFIYINDVGMGNCPHSYIQGTHKFFKDKGFDKKLNVYMDDELVEHYGKENEIIFTAPAGTIIAEDTMGFHKGSTPYDGYRMLIQFEYSIQDVPLADMPEVQCTNRIHLNGLDQSFKNIVKKFYF